MKKDDSIFIDHILHALHKIIAYTEIHSQSSFLKSEITQDAVIRQFEIIGEASKKLSSEFKKRYSDVPWSDMAGMRDKLIHDYVDVDIWIVWTTVEKDVPMLLKQLEGINNQ
ncbi:MAG: DUF86 domain-containing protein [Crocinitomicaceae bacterium]|nr:DUF86 domain-containing protein [Crocinitomicaceae bacterium]MBK8924508.1 DUF86 domain-containing protein [Crocinitomicaceae bacterium]